MGQTIPRKVSGLGELRLFGISGRVRRYNARFLVYILQNFLLVSFMENIFLLCFLVLASACFSRDAMEIQGTTSSPVISALLLKNEFPCIILASLSFAFYREMRLVFSCFAKKFIAPVHEDRW